MHINPLSVNPTKWSNTLKQFLGKLLTNCLSVFDHFVGLALKGLSIWINKTYHYLRGCNTELLGAILLHRMQQKFTGRNIDL